jgi:hypothetical protein
VRAILWGALALGLAACSGSNGADCGGVAPVEGSWEYHAIRTAPPPGSTLDGTLEVLEVDGCDFNGSIAVDETPIGGGEVAPLAGPFFGIAVSPTVVNFDVQFTPGVGRTHVAEVFGDSMAGEWIEGSGRSAPRGSFWARKNAP